MASKTIHPTQQEIEQALPGFVQELRQKRQNLPAEEAEYFDILVGAAVHYAQQEMGEGEIVGNVWHAT